MNTKTLVCVFLTAAQILNEVEEKLRFTYSETIRETGDIPFWTTTGGCCNAIADASHRLGLNDIERAAVLRQFRLLHNNNASHRLWFGEPKLINIETRYTALILAAEYFQTEEML